MIQERMMYGMFSISRNFVSSLVHWNLKKT